MKLNDSSTQNPNQKSRLFFLEFLIVLFFFLIISTVCIRLFTHAKNISDRAERLSQAQTAAASAAEILIAEHGNTDFLYEQYENTDSSCIINIITQSEDSLTHFLIQSMDAGTLSQQNEPSDIMYELSLDLHAPLTRGEVLP